MSLSDRNIESSKNMMKEKATPSWNGQIACPFCDGQGSIGYVTALILKALLDAAAKRP